MVSPAIIDTDSPGSVKTGAMNAVLVGSLAKESISSTTSTGSPPDGEPETSTRDHSSVKGSDGNSSTPWAESPVSKLAMFAVSRVRETGSLKNM